MRENRHATIKAQSFAGKAKGFFPSKYVLIRSLKKVWGGGEGVSGVAGSIKLQETLWIEEILQAFMVNFHFTSGHLISTTGHLIGVKRSVNSVGTLSFCCGKQSFGFRKLLELIWTLNVFHRSMK